MRSLRWIILAVAVVVVLVVAGIIAGGTWLKSYIHSEAFKSEVEARAGQALGGSVQIQAIDFDIFNGVKLQGVVTQIDPRHANGQGALLMRAGSVNCTYAWTELFHRQLKLTGLTLDQPQIVLTKERTAPAESLPQTTDSGTGTSGSYGGQGAASGTSGRTGTPSLFQFVLDRAKVNDGAVSVRDESGASIVDLKGFNANANTSGYDEGKDVTGTVQIADMTFSSGLRATQFSTPFVYHGGTLEAKPLSASAYSGSLAGDYQLGSAGPSILDLNGKGLDVTQFTNSTTSSSQARLTGSLDLQSKWRSAESGELNGEGDAQLSNGKLNGVKMLEDVSNLLRIKELFAPDISQAKTHFLVENRQTRFTGLQLQSTIFSMTGDGVVGFDGGLDANLVLILTRDAMSKLPKEVAASFVQQQDGTGSIAFHVTGTTANPQTDLASRLLIQNTQIQNVINKALNKFFH